MKKLMLAAILTFGLATSVFAQSTALPTSRFVMDVRGSVSEVAAYTARLYLDGVGTGQVVTLSCVPTTDTLIQRCTTPMPAVTPGPIHTAEFTVANEAGESARSTPLTFRLIAVPNPPFNVGVINGQ